MNDLDRFHLVMDVIDRVSMLERSAAHINVPLSSRSKQGLTLSQIAPVIEL
jgi:phosphoketolase